MTSVQPRNNEQTQKLTGVVPHSKHVRKDLSPSSSSSSSEDSREAARARRRAKGAQRRPREPPKFIPAAEEQGVEVPRSMTPKRIADKAQGVASASPAPSNRSSVAASVQGEGWTQGAEAAVPRHPTFSLETSLKAQLGDVQRQLQSLSEVVGDIASQHTELATQTDPIDIDAVVFKEGIVKKSFKEAPGVFDRADSLFPSKLSIKPNARDTTRRTSKGSLVGPRPQASQQTKKQALGVSASSLTASTVARTYYHDPTKELTVTIIGVSGLSETRLSSDGFADLYACCEIAGRPNSKFQTSVVCQTLEPVWNHMSKLSGFEQGDTLHFTVWDKDPWDKDHFLGKAIVTESMLNVGTGEEGFEGNIRLHGSNQSAMLAVKILVQDRRISHGEEDGNPGMSELWPVWRNSSGSNSVRERESSSAPYINSMMAELRAQRLTVAEDSEDEDIWCRCRCCDGFGKFVQRRLMVRPGSWKNMVWQLPGGAFILYDMIMIPFQFFEVPDNDYMTFFGLLATVYWSLDCLHTFCVCYEEVGQVVSSPRKVALNYAKTWLVPDLFILSSDWVVTIWQSSASLGSRSWRSAKILRSFRVLRSAKVYRILIQLVDRLQSQSVVLWLKVGSLLVGVVMIAHYVSCYWYALGDKALMGMTEIQLEKTWLSELGISTDQVPLLYITSLQWSLAQSGLSSWNTVVATNWVECLFSQAVTILWIVLTAGICSTFTLWFLQMRDTKLEYEHQEALLRKYLLENRIPNSLGNNVVRFMRLNHHSLQHRVNESAIYLFNDLPLTLRVQLHRQIHGPIFVSHVIFRMLDDDTLDAICHLAVHDVAWFAGQQVFDRGDPARFAYFTRSGEMAYSAQGGSERVRAYSWIAEVALWRRWTHVGSLASKTSSNAACVDVDKFNAIMAQSQRFGEDLSILRSYAQLASAHFSCTMETDIWSDEAFDMVVQAASETDARLELAVTSMLSRRQVGCKMTSRSSVKKLGPTSARRSWNLSRLVIPGGSGSGNAFRSE